MTLITEPTVITSHPASQDHISVHLTVLRAREGPKAEISCSVLSREKLRGAFLLNSVESRALPPNVTLMSREAGGSPEKLRGAEKIHFSRLLRAFLQPLPYWPQPLKTGVTTGLTL